MTVNRYNELDKIKKYLNIVPEKCNENLNDVSSNESLSNSDELIYGKEELYKEETVPCNDLELMIETLNYNTQTNEAKNRKRK